jgi:hypothetical protein
METSSSPLPYLTLVGDEWENIYQLGLKDRDRHKALFDQVHHFLSTPYPLIDRAAQRMANVLVNYNLEHNPSFARRIQAYAEGLNRTPSEVAIATMIPELVSGLSKWLPGLPSGLMGCSSFLMLDSQTQTPMHGRILDFPLHGNFDGGERVLQTRFNNVHEVLSFGSIGFPFHSITGMNEQGMTLALHQKFTHVFDPKGTSVFELAHELLQTCSTSKEALQFLKNQKSITTWCFIMSFAKSSDVVVADIMGTELVAQTYKLGPDDILYFNNDPLKKSVLKKSSLPLGIPEYNSIRLACANRKIELFNKLKKRGPLELQRFMSTPLQFLTKTSKAQLHESVEHQFDCLTLSSVQSIVMNPGAQYANFIPGQAPKLFCGEVFEFHSCFTETKQKLTNLATKKVPVTEDSYREGLRHYAAAQAALDSHQLHQSYHHLQMGMAIFKEGPLYHYGRFFLQVAEYMSEEHPLIRARLIKEFLELRELLSPYLRDLCTIFVIRLERLIGKPPRFSMKDIDHKELKKVQRLEQRIPTPLLFKATTLVMALRLDIRDVVSAGLRP